MAKLFGASLDETREQRTQRHGKNIRRFFDWAMENECNIQVAYPRSGRQWMSNVIYELTGKFSVMPYDVNYDKYRNIAIFTTHGLRFNYHPILERNKKIKLILLLRDPRACAISGVYRICIRERPFEEKREYFEETVKMFVDDVCRNWKNCITPYRKYNPLIIQYEHLCLEPVKIIERILNFTELEKMTEEVENAISGSNEIRDYIYDGKKLLEIRKKKQFDSGISRYNHFCLRWKKDIFWKQEFSDMIYDKAGGLMEEFGYGRYEHDLKKWQKQIDEEQKQNSV